MRKHKFKITVYRDEPTGVVNVKGSGTCEDLETAAAAIVLSLIKMLKEDGSGYEPVDILETVCEFIIDYVADNLDATFIGDMATVDEKLVKELELYEKLVKELELYEKLGEATDRYATHRADEKLATGGETGPENYETEDA